MKDDGGEAGKAAGTGGGDALVGRSDGDDGGEMCFSDTWCIVGRSARHTNVPGAMVRDHKVVTTSAAPHLALGFEKRRAHRMRELHRSAGHSF